MQRMKCSSVVGGGLLGLLCVCSPGLAGADGGAGPREPEASLLHETLGLRELQAFSALRGGWRPLPPARARVRVVSLWSLRCQPCLDELPELTALAAEYRRQGPDVEFLFIADPPDENPRPEVEAFWREPRIARLADVCQTRQLGELRQDSGRTCRLDLHGIDTVRPRDDSDLVTLQSKAPMRPLTLLVDSEGAVRQVFVGSLLQRKRIFTESIDRLSKLLAGPGRGRAPQHRR